jgi:prepilin-type N-terminal cleavage/methylation domain-containing protein
MKTAFKQYGVSLIEVLVVLVILLIGILSVVRLFPPGFLINQQTEATTFASRLAKQEVDRYTNNSANLMNAIVPVVPVASANPPGYTFQIDLNATPNDLSDVETAPFGVDPYYVSNVNKIRRVLDEVVRIPIPSPIASGVRGSIYVLSSGPIYDVAWDQSGVTDTLFVNGAPMIRNIQDAASDPTPNLWGPGQYAIDYDDNQIGVAPVNYSRIFKISFSYYDTNNNVQTNPGIEFTVAPNINGWISLTSLPGWPSDFRSLLPDSDSVSRAFRRVTVGNWSDDPYEFGVLSPTIAGFANIGVLVFNPLAYNQVEQTPSGTIPLSARISYDVLDWRIIREDRPMPASPPYNVRVTLKNLKALGELGEDQEPYTGLFRTTNPSEQVDFLVYNLSTGQQVPRTEYTVDYKEGIVRFSDAFGAANAAVTFRFYYKAKGEWALQAQKAANLYQRFATPNLGFGQFYLGTQSDTGRDPAAPTRMYFPLMEAGKTISIREIYYRDAANNLRRASNVSFRIEDNASRFVDLGSGPLTFIDLTEPRDSVFGRPRFDAVSWATGEPLIPANGVQGISFKSRVIWSNGATVTEAAGGNVVRYRWRKLDVDTFLTRSGSL